MNAATVWVLGFFLFHGDQSSWQEHGPFTESQCVQCVHELWTARSQLQQLFPARKLGSGYGCMQESAAVVLADPQRFRPSPCGE